MTDFKKILDKAKELEKKMKESQENIKKIRAEGISVSPHYIKDPIFLRGEFLTKGQTYGSSGFPFNSPYASKKYHYSPDLVPNAIKGLNTVAVVGIHEQMSKEDIDDIAIAINKVANFLSR